MTTWTDEYLTLVDDCEKRESRLTQWQVEFIDSIRHQLENEKPLSIRQTETLETIWELATAEG